MTWWQWAILYVIAILVFLYIWHLGIQRGKRQKREFEAWLEEQRTNDPGPAPSPPAAYYVRFLPPKEVDTGVLVFVFSHSGDQPPRLKEIREMHPEVFAAPGFYSLMKATGDTLNVTEGPNE